MSKSENIPPGWIRNGFRYIMNILEEITAGMAHTVIVNSNYTKHVFQENFPLVSVSNNRKKRDLVSLKKYVIMKRHYPRILYTAVDKKN
jgi:hypothetical protein